MLRPICAIYAATIVIGLMTPCRADDAATLAACMQGERDANRPVINCVGRISDPCLQLPEGQSTVGMVECIDKETKVWDAMLNREYGRLLSILKGKAADEVRKAQRNWIASRDSDCVVPYAIFEGGTMAQPIAADCVRSHTAERAVLVRAWREMAQPE